MESEGHFFLKKCHRVNAGKFRQLNLVGDEPEWVTEIRTIILFMKWRYEIHIWGVQLFPNNNFMDNKCKPWCDFTRMEYVKTYIWSTHTHIYIHIVLYMYILMHTFVCVCVCVYTHERNLYQRRSLVRSETTLVPLLSSSNNSTLSFSVLSVPFLPPTWAGCLGSYSSVMGRFKGFLS